MTGPRALAALAVAASLALAACGDDDGGEPTTAAVKPPRCAPAHLDAIGEEPKDEAIADARENDEFGIQKLKRKLRPPINWDQNPISSSAFQGKLQDLTWTDTLLYAYVQGDRGALAQARDIVLDWVAANPFVNPYVGDNVRGDPKPWIDKISAERVPYIAWVYAAAGCEGMLSKSQRATLRDSLIQHGAFLADPASYHATNHGLYADQGLDLLTELAPHLPQAKGWSDLAEERFADNLRAHVVGGEGFWLEHSAGYQLAITRLLQRFIALGGSSKQLRRLERQMRDASGWMIEPDGQVVLYGDTNDKQPTPEELEVAAGQQGMKWMPRSGLAFVKRRDPAAYLAVFSSFHSTTHKDADDLSFDLFDSGTRIVSDTGLYHKDFDTHFTFQNSTRAHSVLHTLTDLPLTDAAAYGSGLEARGEAHGWYAVLGENPLLAQQGVDHRRLWLYRPGYALIVYDEVRSAYPHTYERLFQIGPGIAVSGTSSQLGLSADGLDGTLTSTASAPQTLDLARGERHPLAGYVFPAFRQAVARYTVAYTTTASDLDATAAFGIEPGLEPTATFDPTASGGHATTLDVASAGERLGAITVRREGERLELEVPQVLQP